MIYLCMFDDKPCLSGLSFGFTFAFGSENNTQVRKWQKRSREDKTEQVRTSQDKSGQVRTSQDKTYWTTKGSRAWPPDRQLKTRRSGPTCGPRVDHQTRVNNRFTDQPTDGESLSLMCVGAHNQIFRQCEIFSIQFIWMNDSKHKPVAKGRFFF